MNRLPGWFKQKIPAAQTLDTIKLLSEYRVNTVCSRAACPNTNYCFGKRELTFMILGNTCTRNCRFCAVEKSNKTVLPVETDEPRRICAIIEKLGLKYVVVTSVTRDDLSDGGAGQFVETINSIRSLNPDIKIEILIPDFSGSVQSLKKVTDTNASVIGHNLETVRRLCRELRPKADYGRSLGVLRAINELNSRTITKSSLMLGLGETEQEVLEALADLLSAECDMVTLGQYLAPSKEHYPVKEFIEEQQFSKYRDIAYKMGFKSVLSAPLARSSYMAHELYEEINTKNKLNT